MYTRAHDPELALALELQLQQATLVGVLYCLVTIELRVARH